MPYLGNVPAEAYTNTVKDSFNGDASTTAFTLSQPSTTNNLRVVVENVIQDPTVAYTVSGTTLTFTSAPPVGTANIYAVHLGPATQTAVPPSEINNATTYTSDLTVQGAFTSQGIDDNATSTAMTLDSSGNLLVGKTAASSNTVGFETKPTGFTAATRDGNTVLILNRTTSEGTIADFRKDGTVVGSVGTEGGDLVVDGGSGHVGVRFMAGTLRPRDAGTVSDGGVDLGSTNGRWQDLYLSGGVYLGGTGSANYLDDYEEGTWTPTMVGVGSFVANFARYVKVGQHVFVSCYLSTLTSKNSSQVVVGGLPFTVASAGYSSAIFETSTAGNWGLIRAQSSNTQAQAFKFNETSSHRENYLGTDLGAHVIFGLSYISTA